MSFWEAATYLAVTILGPGALVVFGWFLHDARKILKELERGPDA